MPKVLIIGAGPCGLGAAWRLADEGCEDWLVLEQNGYAGGLGASFVDEAGFTWDVGGHVLFSHYGPFDRAIDEVMAGEMLHHQRRAYIRFKERWVPYPFQYNVHRLPVDDCVECLAELAKVPPKPDRSNFLAWNRSVMGKGITEIFMEPYNLRVWSHPLEKMSANWIAERVATIDFRKALRNALTQTDESAWGPNATFAFPRHGGTGEIYRRMADRLGDRIVYGERVTQIDRARRKVKTAAGNQYDYEVLISSAALQDLVPRIADAPADVVEAAQRLAFNSLVIVGLGFKGATRHDQCWMYFCERDMPAYRVTNFGHYSPGNVPDGRDEAFCAYMCEVSFPSDTATAARADDVTAQLIRGLAKAELIGGQDEPVTTYTLTVPRGYPIPTLERDAALVKIHSFLEADGILSRGRFGAYLYEMGNMDHSFMQGWEAAGRTAKGEEETVIGGW